MKDEILKNLAIAISLLDQVSVSGRQNRSNLSNGIAILDRMGEILAEVELVVPEPEPRPEDGPGEET
jgi:hypothetical protein